MIRRSLTLALTALALGACAAQSPAPAASPTVADVPVMATAAPESFTVTSADLRADGTFDESIIGSALEWCDGPGESVAVEWTDPPAGTTAFGLRMDNLTRDFTYWLQYDIDVESRGVEHDRAQSLGGRSGTTSAGVRYAVAPCPEPGEVHELQITVYALDVTLSEHGLRPDDFADGITGHVLAEASVTGQIEGPAVTE